MSTSSNTSSIVVVSSSMTGTTSGPPGSKSRFPRMQECAHFHYEVNTVEMPKNFRAVMLANGENEVSSAITTSSGGDTNKMHPYYNNSTGSLVNPNSNNADTAATLCPPSSSNSIWFQIQITAQEKKWIIYRTYENFRYLDKFLHDCIFDRKFSCLEELASLPSSDDPMTSSMVSTTSNSHTPSSTLRRHHKHSQQQQHHNSELVKQLRHSLGVYLNRFCEIAFINPINCGPILNWFELDNKGNRLLAIDDSPINIPGVAAAVVKKRYVSQALDELSLEVGNMISVIDMPPADESIWWRGKKELEVGFFPSECVELIRSANYTANSPGQNAASSSNGSTSPGGYHHDHFTRSASNQSVRLKHGKLITLLRSFFNTRPARIQLQSKGILRQRVFGCDLGEHLSNIQQDVPKLLMICTEFIEKNGIVDGIYRHTGLQSNIQRLRNAFDEERFDEIHNEIYVNDIHSVSSLLKMYFRELPNPLLTYQLYNKFIRAVNVDDKIIEIHDVVQQLPPPHYRTLAFLMKHLHQLAKYSTETNMNTKNLAIVWAPNLLKSKEMDSKDCMQYDMLHSITLQANITEFLIANADTIFNDKFASLVRKNDLKNNIAKNYRPISICYNTGGTKLLSLEEAQDKYKQVGPADLPKYHTVIDLPEIKKKKPKEQPKNNKSSPATQNNVPANIQIQQQFESLQKQQQQSYECSTTPITTSASILIPPSSTHTGENSSSHTPTGSMYTSSISPPTNSGSPAFKSLFRNLRVGSLKHPSPSSQANSSSPSIAPPPSIPNAQQLIEELKQHNSQSALTRTSSTFKPPSNLISAGDQMKADYSNCITQLQSAAAQAVTSSLSTSETTAPSILVRTSRLNHSQTSIKYSPSGKMTTFKETLVASPLVEDRKTDSNPVPSKRRTIQPQYQLPSSSSTSSFSMPTSNSSTHLSTFCKNTAPSSNNQNEPASTSSSTDSKEISCATNSSSCTNTDKTEDEMRQIVDYMNRFEAENISKNSYNKLEETVNQESQPATSPVKPVITEPIINVNSDVVNGTKDVVTLISAELNQTESKLRLSSSSLSSSVDSCLDQQTGNQNKDTNIEECPEGPSHQHINNIESNDEDQYEKVILNNSVGSGGSIFSPQHQSDPTPVVEHVISRPAEHIYVNIRGDTRGDEGEEKENIAIRESTGFDVANLLGNAQDDGGDRQIKHSDTMGFDSELVELNQQIRELLTSEDLIEESKVLNEIINENNSMPNDEIVRTTSEDKVVPQNPVTPKKRRSENMSDGTTSELIMVSGNQTAKTSLKKPMVVPKARQSLSTRQSSHANFPQAPTSLNENSLNLQKSLSKSLQDNSRFGETTLVLIETQSVNRMPAEETVVNKDPLDNTVTSVKSKIKLMESIVGTVDAKSTNAVSSKRQNSYSKNERSSSTSSTTSSSYSSSRSPPVSPKTRTTIYTPPSSQVVHDNNNKLNESEYKETRDTVGQEVATTPLGNSSSKRKTVKELLSQFEKS